MKWENAENCKSSTNTRNFVDIWLYDKGIYFDGVVQLNDLHATFQIIEVFKYIIANNNYSQSS